MVLTHLHYDHSGFVGAFPAATIHLAEREVAFWTGRHMPHLQFAGLLELDDLLETVRLNHAGRVRFTTDAEEIAPGIEIFDASGHTPGQIVVRVDTANGPYVVTSDAVHYVDELRLDRPFSTFTDLPQMLDSYQKIRGLAGGDLDRVIAGHDPDVRTRFAPDSHHGSICRIA